MNERHNRRNPFRNVKQDELSDVGKVPFPLFIIHPQILSHFGKVFFAPETLENQG